MAAWLLFPPIRYMGWPRLPFKAEYVERLFAAKGRNSSRAIAILIGRIGDLPLVTAEMGENAQAAGRTILARPADPGGPQKSPPAGGALAECHGGSAHARSPAGAGAAARHRPTGGDFCQPLRHGEHQYRRRSDGPAWWAHSPDPGWRARSRLACPQRWWIAPAQSWLCCAKGRSAWKSCSRHWQKRNQAILYYAIRHG